MIRKPTTWPTNTMAFGCIQEERLWVCIKPLIELECKHCKTRFYICRNCYYGNLYCSCACRIEAQLLAHRKAQRKYRATEKGRETHRIYERNRRMGKNKKTMADETTKTHLTRVIQYPIVKNTTPRCCYCGVVGKIVKIFPPR